MLKENHIRMRNQHILLIIIVMLQIILCIFLGSKRQYLFTDEVMSYGLANCESYAFLNIDRNPTLTEKWVDNRFFLDYMKYDANVDFSFYAAIENQKQDVHPPLYYCFLHIVNFFFQNSNYSVWPGLFFNMIILVFLDLVLYAIARYLFEDTCFASLAVLPVILWGFSAAGLSNVLFIRMYLLSTLEILLFTAIHININKNRNFKWKSWIALAVSVCIGGLTHYYFYIFAAAFGLCEFLYYFFQKRGKEMFLYGSSLIFGVCLALLLFPETFLHLFGYRGSYAAKNVVGYAAEKFALYREWVNKAFFGNTAQFFLILLLFLVFVKVVQAFFVKIKIKSGQGSVFFIELEKLNFDKKTFKISFDEKMIWIFSCLIAILAYMYVAVQGSELWSLRYLYPIFPLLAVFVIFIFLKIIGSSSNSIKLLVVIAVLVLCGMSVKAYGIDWMYPDYIENNCRAQTQELAGKDALIVCRDRGWINVYQAIDLYLEMDETRCILLEEIENIESILGERNSFDDVLICFAADSAFHEEEKTEILDKILSLTGYRSYDLRYDFLTAAYLLEI